MVSIKLQMNIANMLLIDIAQQLFICINALINIGDSITQALEYVRNFDAYFDKHMAMEHHVKSKRRAAYCQFYNIGKMSKYQDYQSSVQLIRALVHSHTYFYCALLTRLPKYIKTSTHCSKHDNQQLHFFPKHCD